MMTRTAAYAQVHSDLRRKIVEGEYAVGSLLPPEPELCRLFSVSRTTVRRAVEILQREGFLDVKQGRGTVVLDFARQNLNAITSTSRTLEQKGFKVTTKSMYIDRVPASAVVARQLGLAEGQEVVRIQRITLADGAPIAIMRNYLPPEKVPGIETEHSFYKLYDFLKDHYDIVFDRAHDRITARNASFSEAQMLEVPVGTALIYMSRTCYQNGEAVSVDHVSIIGGRYEYEIDINE